ncbi:hypothetical protein SXCC_04280 [Gluconacetobacter sp. SXCC-1]|nr:hypothetical protein SXCC_04280 [Gluconacetobacter sp. SXCC-1]
MRLTTISVLSINCGERAARRLLRVFFQAASRGRCLRRITGRAGGLPRMGGSYSLTETKGHSVRNRLTSATTGLIIANGALSRIRRH